MSLAGWSYFEENKGGYRLCLKQAGRLNHRKDRCSQMATIVVGVDGSVAAVRALDWAVEHANNGDTIRLVNAWNLHAVGAFEAPYVPVTDFETQANELVRKMSDGAAEKAAEAGKDIKLESSVNHGHPGQVLIDASNDADLLVVGSRGHGGFTGLLLGSVSTYVVHHTGSPVVVVPEGKGKKGSK